MNRKKIIAAVVLVFMAMAVFAGYLVYDAVFPMAGPVSCPKAQDVLSITVAFNRNDPVELEKAEYEEVLSYIAESKPSRRLTVNDAPAVKDFYLLRIRTEGREYRYYVYQENGKTWTELPYTGAWRTDQALLDHLEKKTTE